MKRIVLSLTLALTFGFWASAEIAVQQAGGGTKPAADDQAQAQTGKTSDQEKPVSIAALAKARVDHARTVFEGVMLSLHETVSPSGGGQPVLMGKSEDAYLWSVRWLNAERDMSSGKEGQVTALERHLARMKKLQQVLSALSGMPPGPGLLAPLWGTEAARYYVAEAEFWLAQEKGKEKEQAGLKRSAGSNPVVRIIKPGLRTIDCVVEQPAFVDAYEQTAIVSKVSGFVKRSCVDIGDKVKKGELLAEIFVPELDEEHQRKVLQVELGKLRVEQARQSVAAAEGNTRTAIARLAEAKANEMKFQAEVVHCESQVKRLTRMAQEKVVDKQVLAEAQGRLDSSKAAWDAAQAAVPAREAERATSEPNLAKAKLDVEIAKTEAKASEADERKAAALLAYAKVTAPYDGIVTVRNVNTGDYVPTISGDKPAPNPSAMFVVVSTGPLRVFLDVPEGYARYVQKGTKAVVRDVSGLQIPATVTRTEWAIRERTRTLRTEIDLPGKECDGLRPGMYVSAQVIVERQDVWMLPREVMVVTGNETCCYLLHDGKAVKTAVVPGLSDGDWIEVTKMKIHGRWAKVGGHENVVMGDLRELTDGQTVKVAGGP
jgi:RND family efflux transporter MFP subunit